MASSLDQGTVQMRLPRAGLDGRVHTRKRQKKRGKERKRLRPELLLRLHLRSNPASLCLVRAALQRATELLRFPETDSRAIVRSVDEALANVIRHAYKGKSDLPIQVICSRLISGTGKKVVGLEIILVDQGVPADLKKLHGRPLDEIRPGGLGLHFIRQSMDITDFRRKKGRNLLRLVKYLPSSEPQAKVQGD